MVELAHLPKRLFINIKKLLEKNRLSDIEVAYLCDRKACNGCGIVQSPDCSHTLDIRHAVNFEKLDDKHYIEVADISHLITK